MSEKMTLDSLKAIMPKASRGNADEELLNLVNGVALDIDVARHYRDNVLTYMSVIRDGRYKFQSYLKAVQYVTYKLMEDSNKDAYIKTFPDRYQRFIDVGKSEKDINSLITAYNKGDLVTRIFEKTIIPPSVAYRDLFHDAMMKEADLMHNAKSETVQEKAARAILEIAAPNEEAKVQIDMNVKESVDIVAQQERMLEMASNRMLDLISKGANVKDVANIRLIVKDGSDDESIDVKSS